MKIQISKTAPIISGVNNNKQTALNVALLTMLFFGGAIAIQAQASGGGAGQVTNTTGSAAAGSPAGDPTNTPVQQIQVSLDKVKTEIVEAVKQMQQANATTPAQQMEKVTKLATQLRELGTNELSDTSQIAVNADHLIKKMRTELAQAKESSSDPNTGAREIYRDVAIKLEPQLSKLIDARGSLTEIRAQLLQKADSLDQFSAAIGFAESASQDIIAAQAFQKALTDMAKFTEQIQNMIDSVNKVPLT